MLPSFKTTWTLKHRHAAGAVIALGITLLTAVPNVVAAESSRSEYAVKAAIIYKIAKFVSWPANTFADRDEALSVCLPTADPIGPALDSLTGKIVQGRPIAVKRLDEINTIQDDCNILFLSKGTNGERSRLVAGVAGAPVLTIGDSNDFVDLGGIVTLEIEQNRVQFAISVGASERAGLGISAQLLQLANIKD